MDRNRESKPNLQRSKSSSAQVPFSDPDWKSSSKFVEKFPMPFSNASYRGSLAARFDSKQNISPLWEDRYVAVDSFQNERENTPPSLNPMAQGSSWSEKKAMKQFQMKIQHLDPGEEGCASSGNSGPLEEDEFRNQSRCHRDGCSSGHQSFKEVCLDVYSD